MTRISIGRADWLKDESLQRLLAALSSDGDEARIVGGAVRNELLGQPVTDIDIATTTLPDQTAERAKTLGFRTVPTGIRHGTVTVIADGRGYEVTTLRADVETDGRHAEVRFGRDWQIDAERRDFTINGLYARADGEVIDLVGGLPDVEAKAVRFIGDAEARIRQDYLRILRFFRFYAWYGFGRPDAAAIKACVRLKDGMGRLSAERIWAELRKLLAAPDPARALLWMRQTSVLTTILPETERWGIDALHPLVKAEQDLGWEVDPMLRLEAMVPPDAERMDTLSRRLRFSKSEAARLLSWAAAITPRADLPESEFAKLLYRADIQSLRDRLMLAQALARGRVSDGGEGLMAAGRYSRLLTYLDGWTKPAFPLTGEDIATKGIAPGPEFGGTLRRLEDEWIASAFTLDRETLLSRIDS